MRTVTRVPDGPVQTVTVSHGPPAAGPAAAGLPDRVGRYLPMAGLGEGGMGIVYEAWDPALRRKVALKLMRPRLGSPERVSHAVQRALREARALARLSHPNVVEVYDCGLHQGRVFLALEIVAGGSLAGWLSRNPRAPWSQVVGLFVEAGRGLAAAHAEGIVHRDFKASNVLVDDGDRVRVTDFGIARLDDAGASQGESDREAQPGPATVRAESSRDSGPLTEVGAVVGTRGYIAPEIFLGRAADERSDQFSFCVALYRALYDASPYLPGAFDDPDDHEDVPAPARHDRGVPRFVASALERGLFLTPSERFADMGALLTALTRDAAGTWSRAGRWLALGGVAAAAVTWSVRERDRSGCQEPDRSLAQVWNDDVREALAARYEATQHAYAPEAWRRVSTRVDAWTGSYASARVQVCARAGQPDFDRRMDCLVRRRGVLAAMLQALSKPTRASVLRAPIAAAELPGPEACIAESLEPEQLPPSRQAEAAVSLAEHGRFDEARGAAADALTEARRGGDGLAQAAGLLARGRVLELAGTYDAAEADLTESYWLGSALGDDTTMMDAATALVRVVGVRQRRHDEAREWVRHATAARERAPPRPEAQAQLAVESAALDAAAGHLPEAVLAYQEAHGLAMALQPARPLRVADVQTRLGGVLRRVDRLGEAARVLDDALAVYDAVLGPSHPARALALQHRASVHEAHGELDRAETIVGEVLALRRAHHGETHPETANTLNTLAGLAYRRGDLERAGELLREALGIRRASLEPQHADVAATLNNLARVDAQRGDYETAARGYREALSMLEPQWREDHPRLAQPLVGLGTALVASGRSVSAIAPLERALAILDAAGEDPAATNSARRSLGYALWELGREPDRAIALLRRARDEAVDPEIRAGLDGWLREHAPG